ncbi:hypothetical protein POM88_011546 [Heracleum sosnowskyi]|uniref:Uncharacterized protein n=1 Tax=Heracleum sosnowskyi TaxID=360622 RepID=A0AAD8MWL0_9APIA|nr:hypothetical protein POM88_011546 [Heracleum sosnowskyi]
MDARSLSGDFMHSLKQPRRISVIPLIRHFISPSPSPLIPTYLYSLTSNRQITSLALGQAADWFRRALAVERVRGNLQLSGYSACGQDGGVKLPRKYVQEGVADADSTLLVTTRPTPGNTLA